MNGCLIASPYLQIHFSDIGFGHNQKAIENQKQLGTCMIVVKKNWF